MLVRTARALLASGPLRQPDSRSCGAATLVFAEMLRNPEYAAQVLQGSFADETLAMHARVTGPADVAGRIQPPWPPALGTPPWAVARHLAARFDTRYAVRLTRHRPGPILGVDELPAALYVGSRWLPRHVVLVVAADSDAMECYEPSSGNLVRVTAGTGGQRSKLAGWAYPWFVVSSPAGGSSLMTSAPWSARTCPA